MNDRVICLAVDVEQGSCNIILVPEGDRRSAIIIDCGYKKCHTVIEEILEDQVNGNIKALILSHNDQDHIGSAISLIDAYHERIEQIYFLRDRNLRDSAFLGHLLRLLPGEAGNKLVRLEQIGPGRRVLVAIKNGCSRLILLHYFVKSPIVSLLVHMESNYGDIGRASLE